MAISRFGVAVALALCWLSCVHLFAQDRDRPSTGATHSVLFLDWQNDGQSFGANTGDQIEIRLGAMVPCAPQISSPAVRLENGALDWPPAPGISTRTYIFDGSAPG